MAREIAILTCPECGHKQPQEIPEKSCLTFYRCGGCRRLIAARELCCVICEFGDRRCPVSHVVVKS